MSSSPSRRRSGLARRPVRIALLVIVGLGVAITAARVVWLRRGADAGRERWRLHDEAMLLFEAEQYEEAAAAYRRVLVDKPTDRTARFNLGLCLVRIGDDTGWAEIEAVAEEDSNFDDAQVALADRAMSRGDVRTAIDHLMIAIDRPPEPPGARWHLAELLIAAGRRGEAMEHLRRVIEQDGDEDFALFRASAAIALAREHGRQADLHRSPLDERARESRYYRHALQEIERTRVLDRAPEDWDERSMAIAALHPFALAALGKNEEALGSIELALRAPLDGGVRAELRVLRAQLFWLEGDAVRADAELAAAIESRGAIDAQGYLAAADLLESRGFRERAAEVLRRGVSLHTRDERMRISLARLLFLSGRVDEAAGVLAGSTEAPATDAMELFRGDLERYRGDRGSARTIYASLLQSDPQRLDVQIRLASLDAQAAFEDGTADVTAIDALENVATEALASRPSDAEAGLALARARILRLRVTPEADRAAELTDIRDVLVRAIDSDPLLFEAHIVLAHVQLQLGNRYEAALGLERVIAALPVERPLLRVLLSDAYRGLGAHERALEEARLAVDGLGEDPRALGVLVSAARLAGQRDIALDALRRLIVVEPEHLAHRLDVAYLLSDAGDVAGAEACFAEAKRLTMEIADEEERASRLQQIAGVEATTYAARGDVGGARRAFEQILERFPGRVDAQIAYGRLLRATGSPDEAERYFQDALAVEPDSLRARRELVDLWADSGELTPALVEVVKRMRVLGGDAALVLYCEGRIAALQDDLQLARERLERCVQGIPDDADAQYALGVVLSRAGRLEDSVAALERASALAPGSVRVRDTLARARFALARELARLGRVNAARSLLEGVVEADPDAAEPRRALAGLLGLTLDVDIGEPQIREMLARDPDDAVVRRMLATALIQKNDFAAASRELLRVAEAEPGDWTVWSTLSLVRLRLGDEAGAERWATRAREAAPDDPRSMAPRLQLLVHQGRSAEAGSLLDAAVVAHPDAGYFLLLRAVLHARESRWEDAVADATRALDVSPGMTRAAHLGVYALRYGLASPARALEFAHACVRRAPDVSEYVFLVGWLASDSGDGEAALEALRPLAERDPPHQPAVESMALILTRRGETTAAREWLDRGLEVNPENPNFHYLLAQSLLADAVADGDPECRGTSRGAVIAALERTLELAPRHHTARNNLAFVLSIDDERLPDALEHALRAGGEAPKHAAYADTIGTILTRMNRLTEAIESFQRGLAIVRESRAILEQPQGVLARSEPGRRERLRRRLERQEAEIRRHYDEALRLRD